MSSSNYIHAPPPPSDLRSQLHVNGFVVIRSILSASTCSALHSAASEATALARTGKWPYIRTLPKQFPPWPSDSSVGIWGVQHLLHPDMQGRSAFAASYFLNEIVDAVKELLECREEQLVMELYNLLVRPERDFELRWHRDDISAEASVEEEERLLGVEKGKGATEKRYSHAQWNLALEDDTSLICVPGSHRRARMAEERSAGPYEGSLEGQVVVRLGKGDVVFYDNNILHRGVYSGSKERFTLHGSMGRVGCGDERARNVLQHGVGEWVRRCGFEETTFDEDLRRRAEGMRNRLVAMGEGRDVGQTLLVDKSIPSSSSFPIFSLRTVKSKSIDRMAEQLLETNYFVCTLGEAAEFNACKPHHYSTVNGFLDFQAQSLSDLPAVAFPLPERTSGSSRHTWLYDAFSFQDLRSCSLAMAGLLDETLSTKGVQRPQCQPSAIAHLCKSCDVSHLFYDQAYAELAHRSTKDLQDLQIYLLPPSSSSRSIKPFLHTHGTGRCPVYREVTEEDVAYMFHTSGTSSGLPKPIPQSHRAAVGVLPCLEGAGQATFTTTPLYHGGISDCFRAWSSGALIWLFPAEIPITAGNIVLSLRCAENAVNQNHLPPVRYFTSVPYVLQMLAAENEGMALLKQMEIVGVGGAALPETAGDDLVGKGVHLVSRFGSAECGFLMSSHRSYARDKNWQYLRAFKGSSALRFETCGGGLSELVVLSGWPHLAKRNREDDSYATSDLFTPHDSIPDAWKYHSRADSQLSLITGKKFDPAPLEDTIATSPALSDVLIFGNGQQYPGALLFRSEEYSDWSDSKIVDEVWTVVHRLNADSQAHAKLSRSMLVVIPSHVLGPEKSSKGTILRSQAEKSYAEVIKRAYEGSQTTGNRDWNAGLESPISDEEIPSFVLQTIRKITGKTGVIPEDADLFLQGVDSVACMQIRAVLQTRILPLESKPLPLNVVYDCGTTKELSTFLSEFRKGKVVSNEDELQIMRDLLRQHSLFQKNDLDRVNMDPHYLPNGISNMVVVLTGATGALGAHLLDQLRNDTRISHIICLLRAADADAARARIDKSLLYRQKASLASSKVKVTCLVSKLGNHNLGLADEAYDYLRNRTSLIIHAAWAVNFSMRLRSFERDHIAGLKNLLDLAVQSTKEGPPRFVFCSSTASVLGHHTSSHIPESISHDPDAASPLGYARSKWVAEAICEQACLQTRLRSSVSVLRIGQLCGDTKNGIWNMTEAWPLMLSTVHATKSLPILKNQPLNWLPVDLAAKAVLQVATTDRYTRSSGISVYHILNDDRSRTWMDLMAWVRKLCNESYDEVSPETWVEQVQELGGSNANHPAKKLLGLWKNAYGGESDRNKKEGIAFSTVETKEAVQVMNEIEAIDEGQFARMWRWIENEMEH